MMDPDPNIAPDADGPDPLTDGSQEPEPEPRRWEPNWVEHRDLSGDIRWLWHRFGTTDHWEFVRYEGGHIWRSVWIVHKLVQRQDGSYALEEMYEAYLPDGQRPPAD